MIHKKKNLSDFQREQLPKAGSSKIGIVVASWNSEITHSLRDGAISLLQKQGMPSDNLIIREVPGSFELPSGAQFLLENYDLDAVIILGCVIQGETRHFDFICQGVTQGVMNLTIQYQKPVIFGLLTTDNMDQAINRAGGKHGNKGIEAAVTALQMIDLWKNK